MYDHTHFSKLATPTININHNYLCTYLLSFSLLLFFVKTCHTGHILENVCICLLLP